MARHAGALHAGARCLAEWRSDKVLCNYDSGGSAIALSAAASSFQRQVALWVTSCIVNDPPKAVSSKEASMILVCPGNESLSGAYASYFPRGRRKGNAVAQEPAWMASSSWCGMEAGSDMVYPAQCVDGLVDRAGGASLRSELRRVAMRELQLKSAADKDKDAALEDEEVLCPVGHAVASAPPLGSSLRESFSVVVHTATPTWPPGCPSGAAQWRKDALSCYGASLRAASAATQGEHKGNGGCVVVSPLICAGTRGAPQEEAAKVAAEAAAEWLFSSSASSGTEAAAVDDGGIRGLWFAVQSEETAAEVLRCFKESPLGMPCREEACDDAGEEGIDSVE